MIRHVPILGWLREYQSAWFRADLIAGLTIMALLVPEGMAYAELAGVGPEAAFYAAPIGLLLYAVFGTSRQLVVAVSSAIAVMSASIVGQVGAADAAEFAALTALLAMLAGVVGVLAGVLNLGRIARFFSGSVLADLYEPAEEHFPDSCSNAPARNSVRLWTPGWIPIPSATRMPRPPPLSWRSTNSRRCSEPILSCPPPRHAARTPAITTSSPTTTS